MIRVILFDDNKNMRRSLEDYFADSKEICITASFPEANEAVKQVKTYAPDVVLMDIQMPGSSGLEALCQISNAHLNTKVIMLTSFDDNEKLFAAICAGAYGYALKTESPENLQNAIKEVHHTGGMYFTSSLAARAWSFLRSHFVQTQPNYVALTERQIDVLKCMVDGLNRKMTAGHLNISVDTVGDHLKEIYRKLQVNSAPEAVREAIRRGLA